MPKIFVASQNMLGDAFNPVEFLATGDKEFMDRYAALEQIALTLKVEDIREYKDEILAGREPGPLHSTWEALAAHAAANGDCVWKFFDTVVLKNDNKLLGARINLLTFAMRPVGSVKQWEWCLHAHEEVKEAVTSQFIACLDGSTYKKDPYMFVWDLACSVIAIKAGEIFTKLCESSYLNNENFTTTAGSFLKTAEDACARAGTDSIVLGVQELPLSDSEREKPYKMVFVQAGFKLIRGEQGVGLFHKGLQRQQQPLIICGGEDGSEGLFSRSAVMSQVCRRFSDLDEKTLDGLTRTTASKTLAVEIDSTLFVVVHAKEPKTTSAARALAAYLKAIVGMWKSTVGVEHSNRWVILSDLNLGKKATADAFAEEWGGEASIEPGSSVATTCKQRSILHGQAYDTNKCHVVVKAPKDKIIASGGCLSSPSVTPDLSSDSVCLPTSLWASDHSQISAVLTLP